MNIKDAKNCLKDAIRLYLAKDENGFYKIPVNRQRPLALMGPAGVGKTDIARQAAGEMHVNFLSYTITHHTRQSIMGLPRLSTREYGGQTYHVTDYTMSEIIAEIHEMMKRTGKKEGVLFLDEFNCASETIAPLMLQFLQNKTFGPHQLPEGWIIILAGNPPEYNKSVKEIDVVTRDRIRLIEIEPSFDVWEEYAVNRGIHPAILAYLSQNRAHFYHFSSTGLQKQLVTARGWEELSQMILLCEEQEVEISVDLLKQYLVNDKICHSFMNYYNVFTKIAAPSEIGSILEGKASDELKKRFSNKSFDVRCAVIWMINDHLQREMQEYCMATKVCDLLYDVLKAVNREEPLYDQLKIRTEKDLYQEFFDDQEEQDGEKSEELIIAEKALKRFRQIVKGCDANEGFEKVRQSFYKMTAEREAKRDRADAAITNVLDFISQVFGETSEMEILLNSLTSSENAVRLMAETGNHSYLKYKKMVFGQLSKATLTRKIKKEA